MVLKARTTDFHCTMNSSSPEVTIIGTPIQRLQVEMRRNAPAPASGMTPAESMIGASTA